jgi:hypothetical protein
LQFVVPLLGGVWFDSRNWHDSNQLAAALRYDHDRPFLHHFGRSKACAEITDKDLAGLRMKVDWHDPENIPGGDC